MKYIISADVQFCIEIEANSADEALAKAYEIEIASQIGNGPWEWQDTVINDDYIEKVED